MNTPYRAAMLVLLVLLVLSVLMTTWHVRAGAQVVTPRPAELRYQALRHEPIATPNRGAVVAGTFAMLVKDRVTGQCFLAVTIGNSLGLSPAECGQ